MVRAISTAAAIALGVGGCGDGGPAASDAAAIDAIGCDQRAPWAPGPPLPLGPTQETAAVALAGKVYVLGGFNGTLGVLPSVQVYDTAACTWSTGPELPMGVHHANAAVVGDTIYVVGAMVGNFVAVGDVWAWTPGAGDGWRARAPMPAGSQRGSAVTAVIDGTIVVAGGLRAGAAVTDVSAYDPAANAWDSTLPPLPAPRDHACGGAIGGTLYVAGGRLADVDTRQATVFELTAGGGWRARAPMPTARGGVACAVVGDRLIVIGGEGDPDNAVHVFPEVEAYAPATDRWTTLAPMPHPRHGLGVAAWDGRVYVPGGADHEGFGAVDTHEILTP